MVLRVEHLSAVLVLLWILRWRDERRELAWQESAGGGAFLPHHPAALLPAAAIFTQVKGYVIWPKSRVSDSVRLNFSRLQIFGEKLRLKQQRSCDTHLGHQDHDHTVLLLRRAEL